jgi:hypothetical protein
MLSRTAILARLKDFRGRKVALEAAIKALERYMAAMRPEGRAKGLKTTVANKKR